MNDKYVTRKNGSRKYCLTLYGEKILEELLNNGQSYVTISEIFDINPDTVSSLAKEHGLSRDNRRKFTINDKYFDKIDDWEKVYWLGFLAADGYINQKRGIIVLGLQVSDKNHIQKFLNAIGSNKTIKEHHSFFNGKDHLTYCVTVNSRYMVDRLYQLGLFGQKSLTLRPPNSTQIPRCWIKYWILGYFDGDGCLSIYSSHNHLRYKLGFLGTKEVIDFIQEFLDVHTKVTLAHNCTGTFEFSLTENKAKEVLDYLYYDIDKDIPLKRKYDKYLQICEIDSKRRYKGG